MDLNPILLSIPIFFALMGLELTYEMYTDKKTYRFNDALTNITTGTLQQVSGVFLEIFKIGIYVWVFNRFALQAIPENIGSFLILFVLWDLMYYWEHRMAHQVSLFWGGHVVHHQSEDFNLSVALRQTSTGVVWGFIFYLPLAILGFSPTHLVLAGGFNLLYQFWIHTEHINRMPQWFETIFNTPSHHRVHHGRDPKYIDKNFAGVFIIWDKIFGTFKTEEEKPNYGVTVPIQSWNPLYANFVHYLDLWTLLKKAKRGSDILGILFNKPGWQPAHLGGYLSPSKVDPNYVKYQTPTNFFNQVYTGIQFLVLLLTATIFLFGLNQLFPFYLKLSIGLWIFWSSGVLGFYSEKSKKNYQILEIARLTLLTFVFYYFGQSISWMPSFSHFLSIPIIILSFYLLTKIK